MPSGGLSFVIQLVRIAACVLIVYTLYTWRETPARPVAQPSIAPPRVTGTPAVDTVRATHAGWLRQTSEHLSAQRFAEAEAAARSAVAMDGPNLEPEARAASFLLHGQALLALGRADEAIAVLARVRSFSSTTTAYIALAAAYHKKEDYGQAAAYMRDYIDSGGQLSPPVYQLLVDSLYQAGAQEQALVHVQNGLARFPDDPVMLTLRDKYARELRVERSMNQSWSDDFVVKYEAVREHEALRAAILSALRESRRRVYADLGLADTRAVPVVVYPSGIAFSEASKAPSWSRAQFDGKIRMPVEAAQNATELARVASHELTHAVVHRLSGGRCPTWLDEGLAQIEEQTDKSWVGARMARSGRLIPLPEIAHGFPAGYDHGRAELAYAQSYLVTRYLVTTHGMTNVRQVLLDLASGATVPEAFTRRLGMDEREIERSWISSLGRQ